MTDHYRQDLAYIHDVGFTDYALGAAPAVLRILSRNGKPGDLAVDLGCGSGVLTEQLASAGFRVHGIDISEAMIELARRRVPSGEFRTGSLFTAKIPQCSAVVSVGECLNYLFDSADDTKRLNVLFRRVYEALGSGGVFVFDVAEPGQVTSGKAVKRFTDAGDWTVLVEVEEDPEKKVLTRRVTTFRKVGDLYRRDDEIHRQRLYALAEVAEALRSVGFRVFTSPRYGTFDLPKKHRVFIARRP